MQLRRRTWSPRGSQDHQIRRQSSPNSYIFSLLLSRALPLLPSSSLHCHQSILLGTWGLTMRQATLQGNKSARAVWTTYCSSVMYPNVRRQPGPSCPNGPYSSLTERSSSFEVRKVCGGALAIGQADEIYSNGPTHVQDFATGMAS
jgi:hypothetical protein